MNAPGTLKLLAAPFTPFTATGELRLSAIAPYADFLQQEGVNGVFVCGTTGEGLSMTLAERRMVLEAWKAALPAGMELIVNVGHACPEDARELARHAGEIGVDGIAGQGAIYFPATTATAVVAMAASLASAAEDTPFYYYHIPSMTRVRVPASEFLPGLIREIPNFRGLKFSQPDLEEFRRCREIAGEDYTLYFGVDEMLLSGMEAGARAAVGSTYNFVAPHFVKMAEALMRGDRPEAERIQALCTRGITRLINEGGLAAMKAVMAWRGVDCGPPRLPLEARPEPAGERLRAELEAMGFLPPA